MWRESELIRFFERLDKRDRNNFIGDDSAIIKIEKGNYLFTKDIIVSGIDFTNSTPPALIGRKALAVSLSDISAMGGIPKFALLGCILPGQLEEEFIKKIYLGARKLARKFNVKIIGGDISSGRELAISSTVIGYTKFSPLTRSGAKPGDAIFVTGKLGGSILGKHLKFTPRVKESCFLIKKYKGSITSMIDISDGLVADLAKICQKSKCSAILYEKNIPVSKSAKKLVKVTRKTGLYHAFFDGEDYELLFTIDKKLGSELLANRRFKFYFIGNIIKTDEKQRGKHSGRVYLQTKDGKIIVLPQRGYEHTGGKSNIKY